MAIIDKDNTPTGPHLATTFDGIELIPIIPGMMLAIIMDPNKPTEALNTIFQKVTPGCITLRLRGTDGVIQDYEYRLDRKILVNDAAKQRFKKNAH